MVVKAKITKSKPIAEDPYMSERQWSVKVKFRLTEKEDYFEERRVSGRNEASAVDRIPTGVDNEHASV
jgi:hypothetical protein